MGYPMAGHLAKAGHDCDRLQSHDCKGGKMGGRARRQVLAKHLPKAHKGAEMVMACVGNDDDLRAVCLGADGAFATMSEGSTFVDHTTFRPQSQPSFMPPPKTAGSRL